MKYLTDYIAEDQTKTFKKHGAFFAFSNKQFNDQRIEGVLYVDSGGGLICPKDKAEELDRELLDIARHGIREDLAENGKRGVIHRELGNHEYSYTHDITDTAAALSDYGITEEEIKAEAGAYLKAFYEWEEAQSRQAVNQ